MKNKRINEPTPAPVEEPKAIDASESAAPVKKRRFSRRTLVKILFVISVIFIMISLTYSWFSSSNSARVNGLEINVTDPNNLVADGLEVKGEVNTVAGNGTEFFATQLESVAVGEPSEGGLQAYKKEPKKAADGSGLYVPLDDDVTSAEAKVENVLVQDFTLKIIGEHTINMMKGSAVSADESVKAALRVALLRFNAEENAYEPIFVWAPYAESATVVYFADDSDSGEEADGASEKTLDKTNSADGDVKYYWGEIGDTPITLGKISGEGKFRIVVWLDGNATDAEYHSVSGQAVTVKLKFLPEGKTQDATDKPTEKSSEEPIE